MTISQLKERDRGREGERVSAFVGNIGPFAYQSLELFSGAKIPMRNATQSLPGTLTSDQ